MARRVEMEIVLLSVERDRRASRICTLTEEFARR
jgi:hypothetical protein